jgi:hypothetical protein
MNAGHKVGTADDAPLWQIMLCILNGLAFSVSQSVQHLRGRFPPNFSVRSKVPFRVSSLLEFGEDLGDESMPSFGGRLGFSLLARNIYPEFQRFGHPQFNFLQPVRMSYAFKISVCVSVASGMRQTHFKLGAREVALSDSSRRTPQCPRVFRVFCLDALSLTNPLNSVEKMRQDIPLL